MSQDEKRSALLVLRTSLLDAIDGGEECRARDAQLSRWIELCDIALGNPVDPWARRYHDAEIKAELTWPQRMVLAEMRSEARFEQEVDKVKKEKADGKKL